MPIFIAPWYLLVGLAAALPVLMHLLWQRKPRPVPFSTLRFLREAAVKTRRSRRLTQFLILLLRVLILLLLALAFSRPKLTTSQGVPAGRRTALIILDASASMQFHQGEKMNLDLARDWVQELVRSFAAGDKLGLLAPGLPEPRIVYPPNSEHDKLLSSLREMKPGFGAVNLLKYLNDLAEHSPEFFDRDGTEIYVFSDFQETAWPAADARELGQRLAKRGVLVFLNQVKPPVIGNAGITQVKLSGPGAGEEGDLRVAATVRGSADFTGGNSLALLLEGKSQDTVTLANLADRSETENLRCRLPGGNTSVNGRLELANDAFALDNLYYFVMPRLAGLPILMVEGNAGDSQTTENSYFLKAALKSGPGNTLFQPRSDDWNHFAATETEDTGILYLNNPPSLDAAIVDRLEKIARRGGTVIIIPGNAGQIQEQLAAVPFLKGLKVEPRITDAPVMTSILPSSSPGEVEKRISAILPKPPSLNIRRRLAFTVLPPGSSVLFEYADGTPFMLEFPLGSGKVWLATLGASRDWSDWPLTPFFVIVQQTLLRSAAGKSFTPLSATVGESMSLEWPEDVVDAEFTRIAPDGLEKRLSLKRRQANLPFPVTGFDEPGIYQLRRGAETRFVAVNVPGPEIELNYLPASGQAAALAPAQVRTAGEWKELREALANARYGRPLWPALLAAAWLLAILEIMAANWRTVRLLPGNLLPGRAT